MRHNVGRLDQFMRLFIGVSLLTYLSKHGLAAPAWPIISLFGSALVLSAAFHYCPIYDALGLSSRDAPVGNG